MTDRYQPNTDYRTSQNNVAPDLHLVSADFTSAQKAQLRRAVEQGFPGASVVRDATATYNCHAYAHARRHAWFIDITRFIEDDYYPFTPGTLRVDDVVVYVKDNAITHSGFIKRLCGNSIVEIRSKWGKAPEVVHAPGNVPDVYGSIVYYLRKRGTFLMDTPEPTADDAQDKVDDLLYSLTSEQSLTELAFASTPTVARRIVSQMPALTELSLYGAAAGQAIAARIANASDDEIAVLAHAVEVLGYTDAVPALAAKVAAIPNDDTVSISHDMLLSAFESLSTQYEADRKSRLIDAASKIK